MNKDDYLPPEPGAWRRFNNLPSDVDDLAAWFELDTGDGHTMRSADAVAFGKVSIGGHMLMHIETDARFIRSTGRWQPARLRTAGNPVDLIVSGLINANPDVVLDWNEIGAARAYCEEPLPPNVTRPKNPDSR